MKKLIASLSLTLCCLQGQAVADVSKAQCLRDAASGFQTAVSAARDTYKSAQLACKGLCNEECRTTYDACVGPFKTALQDCDNQAAETFTAAVNTCQTSTNCGKLQLCYVNRDFQHCLVDPRVARRTALFACAKAANTGLKGAKCSSSLESCNKACRSTPTPTPTATPGTH